MKKSGTRMQKNARETRVVFRLDDVSASSDHAVEQILFETFFESGIPLTVGAIPFLCDGDVHDPAAEGELPLPQEKLAFLAERRARGGLEVAQHGCSHQVRSGVGYRTEFCGRPVSEQRVVIARGKALPRDSGFRFLTLEGCAAEGGGYSAGALRRARQRARIARHLPSFVRRAFAPEGVALYSKDRTLPRGAHRGSASTE